MRLQYNRTEPDGRLTRNLLCCSCGDYDGCQCDTNPSSARCQFGCAPDCAGSLGGKCDWRTWPGSSNGNLYLAHLQSACVGAYTWPYDDAI